MLLRYTKRYVSGLLAGYVIDAFEECADLATAQARLWLLKRHIANQTPFDRGIGSEWLVEHAWISPMPDYPPAPSKRSYPPKTPLQ